MDDHLHYPEDFSTMLGNRFMEGAVIHEASHIKSTQLAYQQWARKHDIYAHPQPVI